MTTCPAKLLTANGDVLCAERESHRGLHGGLMPNGGPFVQWPRLTWDDVELFSRDPGNPHRVPIISAFTVVRPHSGDPWLRLVSWCRANGIRVSA